MIALPSGKQIRAILEKMARDGKKPEPKTAMVFISKSKRRLVMIQPHSIRIRLVCRCHKNMVCTCDTAGFTQGIYQRRIYEKQIKL